MTSVTTRRWVRVLTFAAMLVPVSTAAQEGVADDRRSILSRAELAPPEVSQAAPSTPTRRQRLATAAIIGAGIGAAVGEFALGQALHFPHGPDMLIGAGAGAVIGVLIARSSSVSSSKPKGAIGVIPMLSRSRQSVMITWAVR